MVKLRDYPGLLCDRDQPFGGRGNGVGTAKLLVEIGQLLVCARPLVSAYGSKAANSSEVTEAYRSGTAIRLHGPGSGFVQRGNQFLTIGDSLEQIPVLLVEIGDSLQKLDSGFQRRGSRQRLLREGQSLGAEPASFVELRDIEDRISELRIGGNLVEQTASEVALGGGFVELSLLVSAAVGLHRGLYRVLVTNLRQCDTGR